MAAIPAMVIGFGDHGMQSHVKYFSEAGFELVCGVDTNQNTLDALSINTDFACRRSNVMLRTKIHDLPNKLYDAAFIMTPDRFHIELTAELLKRDKHVFVEKPMADNMDDIQVLNYCFTLAEARNLILTTCHPRRFDPPFVWLKKKLPMFVSAFGKILEFKFDFTYHKPSKLGLHKGLLLDHFSHEIDLMTFLFGVSDFTAHKLYDSETRYNACGIRSDGIAFSFGGTRSLEEKIYPENLVIRFERGEIAINTYSGSLRVYDHDDCEIGSYTTNMKVLKTDYTTRFIRTNQNFHDAIINANVNQSVNYLTHEEMWMNTVSSIILSETGTFDSKEWSYK